jgi:hypothetical protein
VVVDLQRLVVEAVLDFDLVVQVEFFVGHFVCVGVYATPAVWVVRE